MSRRLSDDALEAIADALIAEADRLERERAEDERKGAA